MKICISSGHGLHIRGARGSPCPPELDEVDEARRVVDRVHQILTDNGVISQKFHDNTSYDQSTNLSTIVNWHNAQGDHDLDLSVHFNAYDGSAHGTEVLYVTQSVLAADVSEAISDAGGFTNRGAKYRGDLYFLNNTREPAILIETCFCDNTSDSNLYNDRFEDICVAIAESIAGINIDEQPPIEPPEPIEPPDITERNYIEMRTATQGGVQVLINGFTIHGTYVPDQPIVDLTLTGHGDVCMVINGEMFHNKPPPTPSGTENHCNIETTMFGGAVDNENSAYDGSYLDDTSFYVALPFKFQGTRPQVKVTNRANGKMAVGDIMDVGPWLTDDDDYVNGSARPLAETCHEQGTPLPRGPNSGKVPSNAAGLDVSPAMDRELELNGKGMCDWDFVETS
jgi:N-acetylmuramoyl-L-alanine amidase